MQSIFNDTSEQQGYTRQKIKVKKQNTFISKGRIPKYQPRILEVLIKINFLWVNVTLTNNQNW